VRAAQRAQELERAVALLFLELLGLEKMAAEEGQDLAEKALAQLNSRLHGNLRAADQMLAQHDGSRAMVAVVSDGDGAAVLAQRISALFARPLVLDGVERLFGIRIGVAYATGPDMTSLEQVARDALGQAARSRRPFLAIAGPRVA
jgi:GGDEF domain-containing protein